MNDAKEKSLPQRKKEYELWKNVRSGGEGVNTGSQLPQSDYDLLHALETKQIEELAELSTPIWDRVMHRLWHTSIPVFLEGVTTHARRLFEDPQITDRIWRTLALAQEQPETYDDRVLETMLSWVEDLLPSEIRSRIASAYRIFVRDFLLETALVEGAKYEVDRPGMELSCLPLFHQFVELKTMPQLRRQLPKQQWDDTKMEIEAGLLGYGSATSSWSKRKTIQDFDRTLSSLAVFISHAVSFVIKDVIAAEVYYRINGDTLFALNRMGLPTEFLDGLASLQDKVWQTRGGTVKALEQKIPALVDPENKPWHDAILEQAKKRKARGTGGTQEDEDTPRLDTIPDTSVVTDDIPLEALCDTLLDRDRWTAFLDGWKLLSSQERERLRNNYIFLKILVLSKTIDDLYGAYSAKDGCPQLKCLLSQGISTLVFGLAGGDTPHRRIQSEEDEAFQRETMTALGFDAESLAELIMDADNQKRWNLWRLVYTVSFISVLYRVDDLLQAILDEKMNICLTPERECRFSLPVLLACLLKKNREQELTEAQAAELIDAYSECLCRFKESAAGVHWDKNPLSIHLKSGDIAARAAYPHVLLAGYAPNAFITLYWNLHQGRQLSIDSMRGKQRDLRNSLASLRRFLS